MSDEASRAFQGFESCEIRLWNLETVMKYVLPPQLLESVACFVHFQNYTNCMFENMGGLLVGQK